MRTILFLVGVNPRPMCLAHLLVTGNLIKSAILAECSSGLLEVERHIGLDALFSDVEHPVIVTNTGIVSRLAAYGYLLDTGAKFIMEVDGFQQRLTYNFLVPYGQFLEDWKTLICASLVLHRATDGHVLVAHSPILGQTLSDTLWSLRNHVEMEITPSFYHQPCIFSPFVCFLDEEIRGESRPHERTRRNLPVTLPVSSYGKIERRRLRHDIGVLLKLRIAPEHIAVLTALALLMASVPQIPHLTQFLLLLFLND